MAYISFENVCKYYKMGQNVIAAADNLNFTVDKGEFCVVVGPSGAGKTTLLNILGGMDVCDSGKIMLDGDEVSSFRLEERAQNFPAQLSGGEQQRVSIARALAKNPKLLLCDEPTGALDYQTGKSILKLLWDSCRSTGKTVIVITHNSALTKMADRIIRIKNGQIVSCEKNPSPVPVSEIEW